MNILAIDTATESCSAALLHGDEILERVTIAPRGHADLILAMAQELLEEAGLAIGQCDALALDYGPGAFTGVRIGTSVAQGIAYAMDLPVVGISSLAALAQGLFRESGCMRIIAAIDARMDEVYWGSYRIEEGLARPVAEEGLFKPQQVPTLEGDEWHGVGSGWHSYRQPLVDRYPRQLARIEAMRYPQAADIARLASPLVATGCGAQPSSLAPVYLRNEVVHRPA